MTRKTPASFSSVGRSSLAGAGGGLGRARDAGQVGDVGGDEGQDAGREEGDDAGGEGEGDAERPRQVVDPALGEHANIIARGRQGTGNKEQCGQDVPCSEFLVPLARRYTGAAWQPRSRASRARTSTSRWRRRWGC